MAINFPNSPSLNQYHTVNGITWKWDGTTWKGLAGDLGVATATTIGGIKVVNRLTIDANTGLLSADVQDKTFAGLTDTPASLVGDKWLKVNSGATAVELVDAPAGSFTGLTDTPSTFTASKYVAVNSGATALELVDAPWTGLSSRTTANASTPSLASGEHALLDINNVATSYGLMKIQTSHAAWVTLYISQAARTADVNRAATTDPVPGAGVVAEVITNGDTTQVISPMLMGFNDESTVVDTVYAKVRNETGSATVIQVTLTFVPLEA